ncbi:MAG: sugar ABC transporter substrate-binding protein [Mobilitalea sp.]
MKKKFSALLILMAMLVTMVAGCSKTETSNVAATPTTEPTVAATTEGSSDSSTDSEQKFVGITFPTVGNDFLAMLSDNMKKALEDAGCKVQLDAADNDVTTQIEQIENFTTMGCDIIVVWAVNGEGVSSACQKAMDKGVQILAFAYEIPGASGSVISASDELMAAQAVTMMNEWIEKTFPDAKDGEVKILALTATTTPELGIRSDALKKIADNKKVTLITQEVASADSSDEARKTTENSFLTDSDIDAVLALNGTTALGAESFIDSSSSPVTDKSKFAIFCVDESQEIIAKITASATNESVLRGTVSMGTMDDTINDFMKGMDPLLKGEAPQHITGTAFPINVDTLTAAQ